MAKIQNLSANSEAKLLKTLALSILLAIKLLIIQAAYDTRFYRLLYQWGAQDIHLFAPHYTPINYPLYSQTKISQTTILVISTTILQSNLQLYALCPQIPVFLSKPCNNKEKDSL
jgi:hypothetical protein